MLFELFPAARPDLPLHRPARQGFYSFSLPTGGIGLDLVPVCALVYALSFDLKSGVQKALARIRALSRERQALVSCAVGGYPKRLLDIIVACAALIMLLPIMAAVAILIKTTQRGPAIFAHRRVGQAGRSFSCLKFCTMVGDGDAVLDAYLKSDPIAARQWLEYRKLDRDPRVTRLGNILRKTSLDELPQLFSILRGDMSCVGPRPIVAAELGYYGSKAPYYLAARPGLTGVWQVSGRSKLTYEDRVALDVYYVSHWTWWLDLQIMVRTIPAVLRFGNTA
jgi:exopolysaccharide production protein ExoY